MSSARKLPGSARPSNRAEEERLYLLECEAFRRSEPTLLQWAQAFRKESARPLDFETFPFQRDLYRDFGDKGLPTVDVMKSAQCGISAAGVSLALYAADVWEADVLYILPTGDDAYQFSDTRVKTAIEDSPYLDSRAAGTDSKALKRVGVAWLYLLGSISENKALSRPADLLVLDELDRLDQRNIPKFEKRLGAPTSLKLQRRFSNPSFEDAGIHAHFGRSDQREWLVRCAACRTEARMGWDQEGEDHYVDEERAVRACRKCHRPLGQDAIATGRWVPTRPRIRKRGYHISKLIVPSENIAGLIDAHNKKDEASLQAHYNFDLGLPYSPAGGSLTRALVLACRRAYDLPSRYAGSEWVTAGVDVGRVLHVRITRWMKSGLAAPLFIGEVRTFDELESLWDRYSVNFGLIDERPEEKKAREFMDRFVGRCLLTRWSGDQQRDNIVVDEDKGLVIARRTWSCDQTVAAFAQQKRLLPREIPRDYVSHLTAPYRVVEETSSGQKVARYQTERSERQNHYFFAETYDLLARLARGGPVVSAMGPPPPSLREQVSGKRRGRMLG
jgi:hypothetical protein